MKCAVKMLIIVMPIYILLCLANAKTEIFYMGLIIFSMIQSAAIFLLVRNLMANKKIQRTLTESKEKYLSLFENITENKIRQDELTCTIKQLTALNTLKSKMFTDLTHDIRSPMSAMVSMMELLEEDNCSSDSREIVHEVKKQVRNTFSMVEKLLEWSKSQKYGLVNRDLSKIAEETVTALRSNAAAKDTRIINNMEDGVTIFADKELLSLVLQSLLENAVKFSRRGGLISIQTQQAGQKVIIRAIDTGIVIDPNKAKTLFSQVYAGSTAGTEGEKGAGLGTLICWEFVKCSEGEIWLDSILKKSDTLYFSLPFEAERAIFTYERSV